MKKIFATTILIIIVAVAGSVYYVLNNLDSLVKVAIEKYGTEATQTSVMVESVKISLQDGAAAINGITIANPKDFQAPLAFSLGEIGSKINIATLTEEVIIIDDIRVRTPEVYAEVNKDNKINLNVLKNNLLKMVPQSASVKKEPVPESGSRVEPKIIVHRVLFEEGFIKARVVSLDDKEFKLKLPSFELKELGGTKGAEPAEIIQQIFKKLTDIALSEVKKKGIDKKLDELKAKARTKLDSKKELIKSESKNKLDVKKDEAKDKLRSLFDR